MFPARIRWASLIALALCVWLATLPGVPGQDGDKAGGPNVLRLSATLQAYETVPLFSRVSGFLKQQTVDIGDRIKRGQILAVVDVPELEAQLQMDRTALQKAHSQVASAKGRVKIAEAELEEASFAIKQAETAVKSAAGGVKFREAQLKRLKALADAKGIDEQHLEEAQERLAAAVNAEAMAKLAVGTARAHAQVALARVEQARADLASAEADAQTAQVTIERSEMVIRFATATAPFDGVVTQANVFPGFFVRSVSNAAAPEPLLTLIRTDPCRVVTSIPERDVPFVDIGSPAEVEIAAFPGKKWSTKVTRRTMVIDPGTRGMRVEMDLANPDQKLVPGMHATVTLRLPERKPRP